MADIKDKIAKLLALAESPNEAEAKAALLKARELMAKNKLTPEECKEQKNQSSSRTSPTSSAQPCRTPGRPLSRR